MHDFFARAWEQLAGRDFGPLTFRLTFQPLVALFFAIRSGLRDAREGRPIFLRSAALESDKRRSLARETWQDVGKLFIVAAILDLIYELIVFHRVYPVQALIVAVTLAIVPYLLGRSLTNWIARRIHRKKLP